MINYDNERGGIYVKTELGKQTTSRLTILNAKSPDSGNYTCSAQNTQAASIIVFVDEGKLIKQTISKLFLNSNCRYFFTASSNHQTASMTK